MAPVILALQRTAGMVPRVCVTAQHRELLDQVLELFRIVPDHDLGVMAPGQTPAAVAAAVLSRLEGILVKERPEWVLVQGDTTTTVASALASFYLGIRVGHVEAGLRTGDRRRPFPEEMHRRLAGVLADLHFAPTPGARESLLREGVESSRIAVTGNPVIDALRHVLDKDDAVGGVLPDTVQRRLNAGARLVLVTVHRRESFGAPLEEMCQAIADLVRRDDGAVEVAFPVHPNPVVRRAVHRRLAGIPHVTLLEALSYERFLRLLQSCYLVLTDSGGVQEEAPALGVPVLVLRDLTERPEGEWVGCTRVVGTTRKDIVAVAARLLDDPAARAEMARVALPFGDGLAAERIVAMLRGEPIAPFAFTCGTSDGEPVVP